MWGFIKNMFGYDDLEEVKGAGEGAQEITTDEAAKQGLWQMLSGAFGKDITRGFSLPVWIFEPTSFLQVMAEPLQFDELLFKASMDPDSVERLALIAAFAASTWSIAVRTRKPFNPLLGETFEMVAKDGRYRFFGEQVSHHPPIAASRTIADTFVLELESEVKTKFTGNSVEANPIGTNHFRTSAFDDHITWGYITSCAHNLFIGRMWIDHYGELTITNHTTGDVCKLNFIQCGLWGGSQFEVKGEIVDKAGKKQAVLSGHWNNQMTVQRVGADGKTSEEPRVIWKKPDEDVTAHPFRYNSFVIDSLNGLNEAYQSILLETDSRLRGDRMALEAGDLKLAADEKHRLEELQRARRKKREEEKTEHQPRYFKQIEDPTSCTGLKWEYQGGYWEERDQKVAQLSAEEQAKIAEVSFVGHDVTPTSTEATVPETTSAAVPEADQ